MIMVESYPYPLMVFGYKYKSRYKSDIKQIEYESDIK